MDRIDFFRMILIILLVVSFVLMIVDIVLGPTVVEIIFFYSAANAILIFRVFGVNLITKIIHSLAFIYLAILLTMVDYTRANTLNTLTLLISIVIVSALAMMGVMDPIESHGKNVHAFSGYLAMILFFWMCAFASNFSNRQCIIEMFYMLAFLMLVITPTTSEIRKQERTQET